MVMKWFKPSFSNDNPKLNQMEMSSRLSTLSGRSDKTVTGSVEDINAPKTNDSITDHPTSVISRENIYWSNDVTNML